MVAMRATFKLVLLMQTTMVLTMSLGMYRSCLYECLNCVNTWGKELFNGEMCAEKCAVTGGQSIDTTCASFFTRASRRVSAARQFFHSDDPSGRIRNNYYNGYGKGLQGYRNQRMRMFNPSRSYYAGGSRSALSKDCQRLCRTCESRFTMGMDAHSCLYKCVRTKKKVVSC